ncbi:MAG: hypothetical protein ABIA04_16270 [Pseudomonadota bacterium]
MEDKLKEMIINSSYKDGEKSKIACKKALKIAEDLKLSEKEIGNACDTLEIKIAGCQLGCFK